LPSKQAITFPALGAPGSALIVTVTGVRVALSHRSHQSWLPHTQCKFQLQCLMVLWSYCHRSRRLYQTTLSPAPAVALPVVNVAIKTGDHIPALGAPGSALIVTVTRVRVALLASGRIILGRRIRSVSSNRSA
jgi:hypothetical protein